MGVQILQGAPFSLSPAIRTGEHSQFDAVAATDPATGDTPALPADTATSPDAVVTEEVLTEEDTRSATQEFEDAPTAVSPGKKSGLSNLEIAGLAILGTLAIGAILDKDKKVVENTGEGHRIHAYALASPIARKIAGEIVQGRL